MRKLIILLALLSVVFSQTLVAEKLERNYSYSKYFSNMYNDALDVAVYGWFRIDSAVARPEWATGFHLTANEDANFSNYSKVGDRVLSLFNINERLHTPTYSLANGNTNYYTDDVPFSATADVNQWVFFYVGFGSAQQTRFSYFNLPSGQKSHRLTGVTHQTSKFYKIYCGQSVQYKYWPGQLQKISIIFGQNAYRETGYSVLTTAGPSQELIVDNLERNFRYNKWFKNSNAVVDVAVYGWYKIDSTVNRGDWATAFHLTQNEDANFSNYSRAGDRVLSLFNINERLHTPTYSLANGNTNYYTDDQTFQNSDLNQWVFFYVCFGQSQQARFSYFQLPSGVKSHKLTGVTHQASDYYKIFVGQSVNYRYWPGQLWRVSVLFGEGAYRESNYGDYNNFSPSVASKQCSILYTGCNYTGAATDLCGKNPKLDVYNIRSVFIPSGKWVTLYEGESFSGRYVKYDKSQDCIAFHKWTSFTQKSAETGSKLRKHSKKH